MMLLSVAGLPVSTTCLHCETCPSALATGSLVPQHHQELLTNLIGQHMGNGGLAICMQA